MNSSFDNKPNQLNQCKNCNLIFNDEREFTDHILLNYVEQDANYCDYYGCNQTLSSRNSLIRHVNTHSGYKPYICNTCGQKFSTIGNLKRHERVVCSKNSQILDISIEPNNFEFQKNLFNNNSISTKQDSNLNEETTSTNDNYDEKDINNYAISLNFYLDRQKREHIDEKPLDLSNKRRKVKLDDQNNQNLIKPNYILLNCNQLMLEKITNRCLNNLFGNYFLPEKESSDNSIFKSANQSLNKSTTESLIESINKSMIKSSNEFLNESLIESKSETANESPIQCINESLNKSTTESQDKLKKSFILVDPFDENDYKLIESSLSKNYMCKICDMKLKSTKSLLDHKFKHENNIKPNKCDICNYACFGSLERHNITHSGEKLFECRLCKYKAGLKANVVRHIKSLHKDKFNNKDEIKKLLIIREDSNISNQIQNYNQNSFLNIIPNADQLDIYQQLNEDAQLDEDQQFIGNEQLNNEQFLDKLNQILSSS